MIAVVAAGPKALHPAAHGKARGTRCNLKPSREMPEGIRRAVLPLDRVVAARDSTQADMMIEFINRRRRIYSAKIASNDLSSDQPSGDPAGSGQGDATLLILRRTGCRVRPNPKANSQIWRSNELNPRVFQCLPNLLDGIKIGLDATFRTLQPAYG
jgi:hypothetical protein